MKATTVVWIGTVDLIDSPELGPLATKWPMRLVEDLDENLMMEYASEEQIEEGRCVPNQETWIADYQRNFRDMAPEPSKELVERMKRKGLL